MIYGTGIDIVEVRRMEEIIQKWGGRFVARVFSQGEISYCTSCALPAMHYAARFAAKESFLKSLGMGLGMGLCLRDIEVTSDRQGKPEQKVVALPVKDPFHIIRNVALIIELLRSEQASSVTC